MYIILTEISFLETKNVRKVRKWPNLCSIWPQNVLKLVEKLRLIDWVLGILGLGRCPNI